MYQMPQEDAEQGNKRVTTWLWSRAPSPARGTASLDSGGG